MKNFNLKWLEIFALKIVLMLLIALGAVIPNPVMAQSKCSSLFLSTKNGSYERSLPSQSEFVDLITRLKANSFYKKMFEEFNEKDKGITIQQHVEQVYAQFLIEQKHVYLSPRMRRILPVTIALHDIGKPLAISQGNRELQHLYTTPLMKEYFIKNNWHTKDIEISLALVNFTGFGDIGKKIKSPFEVAREIHELAVNLGLTTAEFYEAKKIFFYSDASSYSQLRRHVFTVNSFGQLDPKSAAYLELDSWIYADLGSRYNDAN